MTPEELEMIAFNLGQETNIPTYVSLLLLRLAVHIGNLEAKLDELAGPRLAVHIGNLEAKLDELAGPEWRSYWELEYKGDTPRPMSVA